ncbi:MAG: SdrD B-like domain-containing protein [Pseudomonadales bacterium]
MTILLCLCAGRVISDSEQEPVHYVVPTDTLWHLADRFLQSPQRWPDLWRTNPHIRDPDLIYPGDPIYLEQKHASAVDLAAKTSERNDKQAPSTKTPATEENRVDTPRISHSGSRVAKSAPATAPARAPTKNKSVATSSAAGADGFRSLQVPARRTTKGAEAYVDQLIDPSKPEDSYLDYAMADESRGPLASIDHSVELLSLYRDDDAYFDSSIDHGLHYIARLNTRNWGQLRMNLIALDEYGDYTGATGTNNGLYRRQSGVARVSLEQYNLPITEQVSMDNVVGTHRQRRYNPFRNRPNLINYRFGAAEPDILGMSSQLKFGQSGVGVSMGRLGKTRGSLLPGFEETEGNVMRGQFTHVLQRHAFSGEIWQTEDQEIIDNRQGYRLAYDHLFGHNTVLSISSVASGGQQALLMGGATETDLSKHDFGTYYFEPDILWLDSRIGDDNAGAFYRYHTQRGPRSYGASIELRRDGLERDAGYRADNGFISLSLSNRLNRRSTLSNVYGYRRLDVKAGGRGSYQEHSLRSYLTRAHSNDSRSSVGLHTRLRSDEQELELTYGWSKDLNNDSTFEFSSSYRHQFAELVDADEMAVNASWQKQFSQGSHLGFGLGYAYGSSALDSNRGFTGYLNVEHPLTQRLGVSLQVDYSRDRAEYESNDLADTLFTNNAFDNDDQYGYRSFSALLKLSYQLNGRSQPAILNAGRYSQGSGRVQGYVYVDANGDGERQPGESGVAGITVFLNSVHPVVTDSRGAYSFPSVGPGQHFLFVDETSLPLPWTLANGEYAPLSVHLRRTTQLDIPVSTVTLAEAQQ